jgi:hypothetical protein
VLGGYPRGPALGREEGDTANPAFELLLIASAGLTAIYAVNPAIDRAGESNAGFAALPWQASTPGYRMRA